MKWASLKEKKPKKETLCVLKLHIIPNSSQCFNYVIGLCIDQDDPFFEDRDGFPYTRFEIDKWAYLEEENER